MNQLVDQYNRPLVISREIKDKDDVAKPSIVPRASSGGKLVNDNNQNYLKKFLTIKPPAKHNEKWQLLNLDEQALSRLDPNNLLEMLVSLSPEVNRALWDFIRFCNPGYTITTLKNGVENKRAKRIIDEFIEELDRLYGSFDILLSKIFTGCFLRGAIFVELVLNKRATEAIDLAVYDPKVARFREIEHPERGVIDELGQEQDGEWVSFQDDDTIIYAALDPHLDSYYGRSLISASLFAAVFLLGLLHDLRRVISQQGYPRLDLSIELEKLAQSMPVEPRDNPQKFEEWIKSAIEEISSYYTNLQPDEAFVHTDAVTVNGSPNIASSLQGIETIIRFVERMLIRSLKSTPILMGSNETVTETHADRQWAIHMAGIQSVQKRVQKVLQRIFKIVLRIRGIQSDVIIKFDELDASEGLKKAMTEYQITLAILQKVSGGLISLEDAQKELQDLTIFRQANKLTTQLNVIKNQNERPNIIREE